MTEETTDSGSQTQTTFYRGGLSEGGPPKILWLEKEQQMQGGKGGAANGTIFIEWEQQREYATCVTGKA
jgi:hypothetical protein